MTKTVALTLVFMVASPPSSFSEDPIKSLSQKLKEAIKTQKPPFVGVFDFTYPRGRMSSGSYLVSERLVTYLVQNKVPVIERRLIQKILEEKKMWDTGLVNTQSIKAVGQIFGVEAIAVGTLSDLTDNETEVMARLIQVDTGKILAGASVVMPRLWRDSPRIPRIAQMRTPVPMAYSYMRPGYETGGRYKLNDVDSSSQKSPYRLSPVPSFMPSSARRLP